MMVATSSPETAAARRSAAPESTPRDPFPASVTADQDRAPEPATGGSRVKIISTSGSESRTSAIFACCSAEDAMTTLAPESRMM